MIPVLPQQNLAPAKPLFDLADKESPTPTYITTGLKELYDDLMKRDKGTFEEVAETTETTSNFIQGKQIFQQTTNGWRIQSVRRADPNKIRAINLMQYFATQNIDAFTSSNPDIEAAEQFRRIEYKEKIRNAEAIWSGYQKKFYNAWFNQQEALHCTISGTYIESVQYDHLVEGSQVFKEIWGHVEVPISEGRGKCFNCEQEGNAEDFTDKPDTTALPSCPNCGSFDITVDPAISQLMPSVTGLQPIKTGDLTLKLIPIQACRFDVRKRAEESSYFIERIRIAKNKLEMILGAKLKFNDADLDKGLKSLDAIQRAGNTLYGENKGIPGDISDRHSTIIDRMSLKPEDYLHIKSLLDEETVSGDMIPAGAKLIDLCPDGMTVLGANNFSSILGIWPGVHHSDEVTSGVSHMRFESGIGRGGEDQVEIQKTFNRNNAQMLKAGETGATPAHFHVEGSVDRKHVKQIGFPGVSIPVKREIAEVLGTTELIRQIPPASIAGTFFQYTYEVLDKYRQMVSHAPDLSNSLLGSRSGGTATEAKISQSNAEQLSSPMQELKADVRLGTATKTMKGYNRHFKGVSQYFSYGTTSNNMSVGQQIKGEDIDCSIEFVVVKDSYRPKTRISQQSGLAASSQIIMNFGGIDVLKANEPDLLHDILKTFDVDLAVDDYDTTEDLCWSRLQQAVQMAGQDPQVIRMSLKPQITPYELHHQDKVTWLAEYLDTPNGAQLSEAERQTIFVLITAHRNGGVEQAGNIEAATNEAQVIGSQPIRDAQAEEQAQQQQGAMAQSAQEHGQNFEANAQQAGIQNEQAEGQRMFEAGKQAHQQNFEAGQQANQHQMDAAKMAVELKRAEMQKGRQANA